MGVRPFVTVTTDVPTENSSSHHNDQTTRSRPLIHRQPVLGKLIKKHEPATALRQPGEHFREVGEEVFIHRLLFSPFSVQSDGGGQVPQVD